MLAHNGNLTNADQLKQDMFLQDLRHMNTNSDSEVLLNVLAHELQAASTKYQVDAETIFKAVAGVHRRVKWRLCRGGDDRRLRLAGLPRSLRHPSAGDGQATRRTQGTEYMVASESVALDTLGFKMLRDVEPGEAVLIDVRGNFVSRQCAERTFHAPCMFEFVYLARPDSVMDGISVYETRVKMGDYLAEKIRQTMPHLDIDAVIPIPDSSRPSAMALATRLNLPYREGFVKNRYIGRTFIMPGQATRRKSVRQKLNAITQEFKGRNVLLVDDSIVRGTTSREIIMMAREAGAKKVYFASASPPVRFANVYGIDMPTRSELIAAFRNDEEICREIGADGTDLPGSRCPQGGGALGQSDGDPLRNLLFRRQLHHRRRYLRCTCSTSRIGAIREAWRRRARRQRRIRRPDGEQLDLNLVQAG
jgi:amidophosphoribosyltransferase